MMISLPSTLTIFTALAGVAEAHLARMPNAALLNPRDITPIPAEQGAARHRMLRQRRARSSPSIGHKFTKRQFAAQLKQKRDLEAQMAAKMVAKKALRSSLGEGTAADQPDNIGAGTATAEEGCTLWHTVIPGEVCLGIIDKSEGLTLEDFYGLNPSVKADCSDLTVGVAYCIDTDHVDADTHNAMAASSSTSTCNSDGVGDRNAPTPVAPTVVVPTVSASSGAGSSVKKVYSKTASSSALAAASASPTSSDSSDSGSSGAFLTSGLIQIATNAFSPSCGSIGAQAQTDSSTGPNGRHQWLTCGISADSPDSPWNPPNVQIHDIVVSELAAEGVFSACAQYFDLFEKHGQINDIPAIFLASFAIQESSCDANAVGDNGGAFGLMQITQDKCPSDGSSCSDPDYNIGTAAKYFRSTLDNVNGNVLLAIGQYNGWSDGLTYRQATAAANSGCCVCQNNLDYIFQMLDGWVLGHDASSMVPFNNLATCGGHQSGNSRKRSTAGGAAMSRWNPSS